LKIILGVIVGLALLCTVCCGVAGYFGVTAVSGVMAEPVVVTLEALNADPAINEALGTPIEQTSRFGVPHYSNQNGNGDARVRFDVAGPKGTATVAGQLDLTNRVWTIESLEIKCSDGSVHALPRTP